MLKELNILNNGDPINQRKRLPDMARIVSGAPITICKGNFM